jgi:hypothetical protein
MAPQMQLPVGIVTGVQIEFCTWTEELVEQIAWLLDYLGSWFI